MIGWPGWMRGCSSAGVPYDLRGSFVSLLAWEGQTMLEVARRGLRPGEAHERGSCYPGRA
jgi:hypothetical protein